MGNTWVRAWALGAPSFEARWLRFPERVSDERWRSVWDLAQGVAKENAVPGLAEVACLDPEDPALEDAPLCGGFRELVASRGSYRASTAAQTVFAAAIADASEERWSGYDILHRLNPDRGDDSGLWQELGKQREQGAQQAWIGLMDCAGRTSPVAIPWWVSGSFPGHWVGLSDAGALKGVVGALRQTGVMEQALRRTPSLSGWFELVVRCEAAGHWLLQVESGS